MKYIFILCTFINITYAENSQLSINERSSKLQNEKTRYFTKDTKEHFMVKALFIEDNEKIYEIISAKDFECINIEGQKDFDHNGRLDVLLSYNACGGNGVPNTFSVILNYGNGYFQKKDIPQTSWKSAIIKKWKNRWSIGIINNFNGYGQTGMEQKESIYVLDDNGVIKELMSAKKSKLVAEIEVYSSDLNENLTSGTYDKKKIIYDLNDDGKKEQIRFQYWERWGSMFSEILLPNGSKQEISVGCKRIGILKSKTKDMHDIVCNHSSLFKWNGKKYIFLE